MNVLQKSSQLLINGSCNIIIPTSILNAVSNAMTILSYPRSQLYYTINMTIDLCVFLYIIFIYKAKIWWLSGACYSFGKSIKLHINRFGGNFSIFQRFNWLFSSLQPLIILVCVFFLGFLALFCYTNTCAFCLARELNVVAWWWPPQFAFWHNMYANLPIFNYISHNLTPEIFRFVSLCADNILL